MKDYPQEDFQLSKEYFEDEKEEGEKEEGKVAFNIILFYIVNRKKTLNII